MSRLMAVAMTEAAVVAREKTVTRRLGWRFLKPGDRLTLVRKSMGRKPGEPLVRLADVEVVSVRREPLLYIADEDIARECVPEDLLATIPDDPDVGSPALRWATWFASKMGCHLMTEVTRIEWRYLENVALEEAP